MSARAVASLLVLSPWLFGTNLVHAQAESPRRPSPQGEGALLNDVFLPISERAAAALTQGDQALAGAASDRSAAFDAWRRALEESEPGDCVPAPRGTESVERAVLRRLQGGAAGLVPAWRERFESSAEIALDAARDDADALSRTALAWPMTRAAARAALALADRAHEEGDEGTTSLWLDRAGADADPKDRALSDAISRRRAALGTSREPEPGATQDRWTAATRLEVEARITLESPAEPRPGIRPGILFLRDGRTFVQGSDSIHVVGPEGRARSFALPALVRQFGWTWIEPFVEEGGLWIQRPATDGERIALVAGRAARTRGNALLLLDEISRSGEPNVAWGYFDGGFRGEIAGSRTLAETLGPGLWEFEPGPVFVGSTVIAQLRQWTAEGEAPPSIDESAVKAWCFAFDARTGLPKWKRLLAVGPSAKVELWGARGIARPADPIPDLAGRLFASTAIGAGVFLDRDGRPIWSVKDRRSPDGGARWRCGASFPPAGASPQADSSLLWAPSDSDRLYPLRADPIESLRDLFFRSPAEIDGHLEPIGLVGDRVFLLSRVGDRDALSSLDLASGARSSSVESPRGERFVVGRLGGAGRALVASERKLRLFDLTRDLYLLDSVPLEGAGSDPAAGIEVRADRAFVAAERALWILRPR